MSRRHWLSALGVLAALASAPAWAGPTISAAPPRVEIDAPPVPGEWETVPGLYARVSGAPEHAELLLHLARHAAVSLPRLATELDVPIGETVHVYLVGSDAEFRALQPGRPPTWADATAYPQSGAIFLRAPGVRGATDVALETVLDHELVHILIGRAFAPVDPPSWLQEGIARVYAGEFGPEDARIIYGTSGGLLGLGELGHAFPRDPTRARLAYAQSADFIAWLRNTHGAHTVPLLVRALAREQDLEQAVLAATGTPLPQLERAWLSRLEEGPPAWLRIFDDGGAFFLGLGAVALVGAGIARRREFNRRMIEREAEERAEDERLAQAGFRWIPGGGLRPI
jgi:hypothetical protein